MQPIRLAVFSALCALAFAGPALAELKPGDKAPGFDAAAYLAGEPFTFKLADALQEGPVVLYFFPAAHTPGCNLEASLFSQAADEFAAHGATVIGVTAGNIDELAEFSSDTRYCGGKFPVAADPGAKIATQYDAVLEQKPEWASRTSYVIAPDGSISAVHSDSKPGPHVKQMLAGVKVLQGQDKAPRANDGGTP